MIRPNLFVDFGLPHNRSLEQKILLPSIPLSTPQTTSPHFPPFPPPNDSPPTKPYKMSHPKLKTTIAILGCGDVGSTLAYTLILQPICSEVILVDLKKDLLNAQVRDLSDATYRGGSGVKVRAGTHRDAGQADIVVVTAGAKQKTGESRLSLLSRNLHILESIFEAMKPISEHTILLLVANPVDILTYFARKLSGLPESQVLGTGTSLDSARLRGILAEKAEVAPNSIDAYVLGEHGDSQFVRTPSRRRRGIKKMWD
jgi:L-lactate dehydrogenase